MTRGTMIGQIIIASVVLVAASPAVATPQGDWPDCSPEADGHNNVTNGGPFGPVHFWDAIPDGQNFYTLYPTSEEHESYPLMVFMHGSTGQYEMYEENLELYASHGFVIVFPFIKSPEKDKNPLTTNTDGTYLLKAIKFAESQNSNASSPLFGRVDPSSVVVAGHSMGGTCAIMAATKLQEIDNVKLVSTQHPGICGPFGPPPWPSTWLKSDFSNMNSRFPVIMTTAKNDVAFWPATDSNAHGCFTGGVNGTAAFIDFSETACAEDKRRQPFPDGGHNCPLKVGFPETPWITTSLKLYAHHNGNPSTRCYEMLWGNTTASLAQDPTVAISELHPPKN